MSECPYLERIDAAGRRHVLGYCHGYEDGRLRIPTVAEFDRFCTMDEHIECNVYRVRLARDREERARRVAAA
jgi:hypothetical protein